MSRVYSKKVIFSLVVVCLYVSALLLGTLCSAMDAGGHDHRTKAHHSLSCLLACSSMVSYETLPPLMPNGFPFVASLFISLFLFISPAKTAMLRSRAPPLFF